MSRHSAKNRSKFEKFSKEIKADFRKQHDLYVNNFIGDVKANPRDFYRYTNSQRKDTQDIFPLKKRKNGSGIAQSDFEKAEEFNGVHRCIHQKWYRTKCHFWIGRLHSWILQRKLKGLNTSKALGPDALHC